MDYLNKRTVEGPNLAAAVLSPLDQIENRILDNARTISEITERLHDHANQVHGYPPAEADGAEKQERDLPSARLERIYFALDMLGTQVNHLSYAAGRNTNLA